MTTKEKIDYEMKTGYNRYENIPLAKLTKDKNEAENFNKEHSKKIFKLPKHI